MPSFSDRIRHRDFGPRPQGAGPHDDLSVSAFFREEKPDGVIFAAAKVGGIHANNTYPVEFLADNVRMAVNSIQAAYENGVKRFLFLGSNLHLPADGPAADRRTSLAHQRVGAHHEAYALAKITGLKLCQYYRKQYGVTYHSAMPTNLYGPGDNYHPENSHVLPALLRRFMKPGIGCRSVTIWGTGTPRREFLYVDDLADALVHLFRLRIPPTGSTSHWRDIAISTSQAHRKNRWLRRQNIDRPQQTRRNAEELTDSRRLQETGWFAKTDLTVGLKHTYQDFLQSQSVGTVRTF